MMDLSVYKFFHIEMPFQTLKTEKLVHDLLPKIFELRIRGYEEFHGAGVFPFSRDELLSNFIVLAKMEKGQYRPQFILRYINASILESFRMQYPLFATLQDPVNSRKTLQEFDKFYTDLRARGKDVVFFGGATYRNNRNKYDREHKKFMHDIFGLSILAGFVRSKADCSILSANTSSKVDKYFHKLGFVDLFDKPVIHNELNGQKAKIQFMETPSTAAWEQFFEIKKLWDNRMEICSAEAGQFKNVS